MASSSSERRRSGRAHLPPPRGLRVLWAKRAEVAALRAVALETAARGWHVFPLVPGGKIPVFHGLDHCHGRGICHGGHQGWQERATRDESQIRRWWTGTKPCNIGIACGPSGLLVVDLDVGTGNDPTAGPDVDPASGQGDGAAAAGDPARGAAVQLARLAAEHCEVVPRTFTVHTPSGGRHHYFRAPHDPQLTISQGRLGPGIDTRGHGGLVVAAGSVRPEGVYRVTDPGPVADLPGWLAGLLAGPATETHHIPGKVHALSEARVHAYLDTVVRSKTAEVRDAAVGTRQWTLKVAARRLGQFVGGGDLDEHDAYQLLYAAARGHLGVEGMDHREIDAAIRGGMKYGRTAPIRLRDRTT